MRNSKIIIKNFLAFVLNLLHRLSNLSDNIFLCCESAFFFAVIMVNGFL